MSKIKGSPGAKKGTMKTKQNVQPEEIRQDLARLLAEILVEDYQQFQNLTEPTVKTARGFARTLEGATST